MKLLHIGLLGIFVGIIGTASADSGPSASDVKAAMVRSGISAGTTFELNGRSYTLHNISVSKTGPESFVVSFVTK